MDAMDAGGSIFTSLCGGSFPYSAHTHSHTLLTPIAVKDLYASRDPEEEVRKAFSLFDEDGTGKVGTHYHARWGTVVWCVSVALLSCQSASRSVSVLVD